MSKDGGPAFPSNSYDGLDSGMTLRDYFAGKAMQGHISSCNILAKAMTEEECNLQWLNAAAFSYRCADAMLAERDK